MNTVGELRRRGLLRPYPQPARDPRLAPNAAGNMNATKNSAGVSPMGADADGGSDGPHR